MIDWGDLRFFVELARSGSLSETARRLKVDHSTVARRIAALEEALRTKLFDRLPRGYALTVEGARIAARAGRLEEEVFAIERIAEGEAGGLSGLVRLSAPPVFASHFIVPRLAPLRARHPGVRLELTGESANASLVRREADIAVRLARPQDGGLVARRLGTLAYGLYGSRAYVEAHPSADWDYLGYDESLDHVPQQRWTAALAGGRPLALQTNDLSSLHQAARTGYGVAALPDFLAAADPDLVRLPVEASAAAREIWMLVHPDLRRSARIRAVMDHLVAITRPLRQA